MSGRSWSGRWGAADRNRQAPGESAHGRTLNRLPGRDYRINEGRDGEWTAKWFDGQGNLVAWFGGDAGLMFLTLDYLAERTEHEFGVDVDRVWRREPEMSGEMQKLMKQAKPVPGSTATKRRNSARRSIRPS